MKIFVTGATGYLGRHLVPYLEERGHRVTGIGSAEADLTRDGSLERFRERYDQIWHLAAWTQAGEFCLHHPGEQWILNQRINTNVLAWWQAAQPQAKLIAMGSSCSYPADQDLAEENYLSGEPVPELYSYGMTKRMLLVGLRALAAQYALKYLYLVPSTLFGPGYHTRGKQLHFIFDLIRKIVRGSLHGEPVVLWGDGEQRRELIFVGDFVRAAAELAGGVEGDVVNLGSGREYSIRWYAERICEHVGYDPARIRYDTDRYVGVRSKQLKIEKVAAMLPDFEWTPVESALRETVRWYAEALKAEEEAE